MAVVIRLKRTGRRNRPCYRISVADARSPRDGRVLESLGLYDPISKDAENQHTLNVERAQHWLRHGAKPSETVHSLFKKHGVYVDDLELGKTKVRKRPGRKVVTKTRLRKQAAKVARAEGKSTRRTERSVARSTAKKAAAAADGE
jgi:small subunit ribosomal protein S16